MIRETIREMDKVAIGRLMLTNREHIIGLEAMDKGLIGTLLRYPYEVRDPAEYFDEIENVKVTKDMLDLARHIVGQKSGSFEPGKFEDQYETALVDLINRKPRRQTDHPKERPRGENVVDLMDALRKSVGGAAAATQPPKKPAKKRIRAHLSEGNADAHRRQEARQRGCGEEAGVQKRNGSRLNASGQRPIDVRNHARILGTPWMLVDHRIAARRGAFRPWMHKRA